MSGSDNEPLSDETGKSLVDVAKTFMLALELLRKAFLGDDPTMRITNAVKTSTDQPPDWAMSLAKLFESTGGATAVAAASESSPQKEPETYGFADTKDRLEAGKTFPVKPVEKTGPQIEKEKREAATNASPVSAFDRPQAVIVVGPKPLPVEVIKGGTGGTTAPPPPAAKKTDEGPSWLTQFATAVAHGGPLGGGFQHLGEKLQAGKLSPSGKAGPIEMVMGQFAMKMGMILGPLTALGPILAANNSGMSVFQKAVGIMGNTLAPLVLPVFALLATAVIAVSDEIWARLVPNLKEWYSWIISKGVPAIVALTDAAGKAADAVLWWIDRIKNPEKILEGPKDKKTYADNRAGGVAEAGDHLVKTFDITGGLASKVTGGGIQQGNSWLAGKIRKNLPGADKYLPGLKRVEETGLGYGQDQFLKPLAPAKKESSMAAQIRAAAENANKNMRIGETPVKPAGETAEIKKGQPETSGQPRAPKPTGPESVNKILQEVGQSLRKSIGPQASYSQLAEVRKSAQLDALNADPLGVKALQRSAESIEKLMQSIAENTARTPEPQFARPKAEQGKT